MLELFCVDAKIALHQILLQLFDIHNVLLGDCSSYIIGAALQQINGNKKWNPRRGFHKKTGPSGDRTLDNTIKSRVLYQLS